MASKKSGGADFLLRMEPKIKARLDRAAKEDGTTIRDLVLYAIEQMLDIRDGEIAADKKRASLEHRLNLKFDELVAALAGGNLASLSADKRIELHYVAEDAIKKWCDRVATYYHAQPKTPIERLAQNYRDLEAELEGVQQIDTSDEGLPGKYGYDPDDLLDGDEAEPDDETWE
jgi:hypothetical protein